MNTNLKKALTAYLGLPPTLVKTERSKTIAVSFYPSIEFFEQITLDKRQLKRLKRKYNVK